jgi:dolichol-phosphate mannosyltransferase
MRQLTMVIPVYNEAENLPILLRDLLALPFPKVNILVVDDASPDGSGEIAEQFKRESGNRVDVLHRTGKLGLGTAYLDGFRRILTTDAQAIGQMDADLSHPVDKIPELYQSLAFNDVAIGSRYVPGGSVDINWPLWRKWLSAFGNFYARTILRLPLQDVTGGFKLWRREALEQLPLSRVHSNGYAFQVEMAYIAHRSGFTFTEIPIYFADRQWGISKMSLKIQREAAIRVWQLLREYRDLRPVNLPGEAAYH